MKRMIAAVALTASLLPGARADLDMACGVYICSAALHIPECYFIKVAMWKRVLQLPPKSPIPAPSECFKKLGSIAGTEDMTPMELALAAAESSGDVYTMKETRASLIYAKKWNPNKGGEWVDIPDCSVPPRIIDMKSPDRLTRAELAPLYDGGPPWFAVADMKQTGTFRNGVQYGHTQYINDKWRDAQRYDKRDFERDSVTGKIRPVGELDASNPDAIEITAGSPCVDQPFPEPSEPTFRMATSGSCSVSQKTFPGSSKPSLPSPALGAVVATNIDKMTIRRVSNNNEIHSYSKRPAITIDNRHVLLGNRVRRISDGALVATFAAMNTESVVSLSDPDTVWGVAGGNVIRGSISSGTSVVHMSAYGARLMGDNEGTLSADDRYMTVDNGHTLMVLDLHNRSIAGKHTTSGALNGFSISLDGQYVAWVEGGTLRTATRTFSQISNTGLSSAHSDFAVDVNGDQVYVHFTAGDYFTIVNPRKNTLTRRYFGGDTSNGHVSGRNAGRPGWAYFGFYKDARLAAVKLDYAPTVTFEDWGHYQDHDINHKKYDYYSTAKPTVSSDGRLVLFTSTWNKTQPRRDYIMECAA